jgi:hypothetical protein
MTLWKTIPATIDRIMGLKSPKPGSSRSAKPAPAMTPVRTSPGHIAAGF